jgi:two-component system, NtrC family, response regulator HydG
MGTEILLVDDNEEFLDSTRDVLENEGYQVATATSGENALNQVDKGTFDVVLMDIKMPGMNGVETFIKMKEKKPGIKVILFTAYSLGEWIHRANEESACAVFNKPLDMVELLKTIKSICKDIDCTCILLADDNKDFCNSLQDSLAQAGYEVVVSYDSEDAVKKAQQKPYDILLLDMKLPPKNGLEAYRRIKTMQPNLITIIISGYIQKLEDMIHEALNEDVYTCLPKPVDMDKLLALLKNLSQDSKNDMQFKGGT